MFADAFREKNFLRDECHVVTGLRCLQKNRKLRTQRKLTSARSDVNLFQCCRARREFLRANSAIAIHRSVTIHFIPDFGPSTAGFSGACVFFALLARHAKKEGLDIIEPFFAPLTQFQKHPNRNSALPAVAEPGAIIKSRRRVVARTVVIRVRTWIRIRPSVVDVPALRRGRVVAWRNGTERQQATNRGK